MLRAQQHLGSCGLGSASTRRFAVGVELIGGLSAATWGTWSVSAKAGNLLGSARGIAQPADLKFDAPAFACWVAGVAEELKMKVVRGDLVKLALDGRFEVIIHGCNCQCEMGAGIAKVIKQTFPEAYK